MKSSIKFLVSIVWVATLASSASAQGDPSSAGLVAVLDVAKVFKDNAMFTSRMEAIKREAEQFQQYLANEETKLRTDAERLNTFTPNSVDYRNLEAELEQRQASLRTEARQRNTDLLNREAGIYFDTYVQMQSVVASLAEQFGITLVMRFDSEPINPENRPDVVKGVNRNVVFQKNLDLTGMVTKKMEEIAGAGSRGNMK